MNPCESVQRRLVHLALGQLDDAALDAVRRHVDSCAACRKEAAAVTSTVLALRQSQRLKASPRFRASLERRLDRLEEPAPEGALSGLEGVHFRVLLFQHRLRTSRRLRWQLAAAGILFLIGGFMAFSGDSPESPRPVPVALPFEPDLPDHLVPLDDPDTERRAREQLVESQFADRRPDDVAPFEPVFVAPEQPSEPAPPTVRPDPGAVTQLEPIPDTPVGRRPQRPDPPAGPPVVTQDRPGVEPIRGVTDSVHRGLRWLARQQREDGLWTPGDGDPDLTVAATAAAVLAFLSDGHDGRGLTPQAETVRRGVAALWDQANPDGSIGRASAPAAQCLNQAIACLALTEHYLLRRPAQDDPEWAAPRQILVDGLDHLERRFLELFHGHPALRRGAGENAAWAALALWTARRSETESGLDWNLSADLDQRIAVMLQRLQNQSSPMEAARGHALLAMVSPVHGDGSQSTWTDEWRRAVTPVLANPAKAPPSLRFLVASALCPWDPSPPARRLWNSFQPDLERALMSLQDPAAGFFAARQIGAFEGGPAFHTALSVVTLNVPQRAERLRQAVNR